MPDIVHKTPIRVRYAETDRMGYVYYSHYLVWFEVGRTEYLRARGLPYGRLEDRGCFLPVHRLQVEYHTPARYEDDLVVTSRVVKAGKSRVAFENKVMRGEETLAEAIVELACLGKDERPMRLPEDLLRLLDGEAGE